MGFFVTLVKGWKPLSNVTKSSIKKLNLLVYYVYKAIKSTKGEYDILCLSLFRSCRFVGYKQFLWWIHNWLVKGVVKVIPSCALWSDGKVILQSMDVISLSSDHKARQLYWDNWCTLRWLNFRDLLNLGANHEGLPKLCLWHKINPLPCRYTTFQRLFDIAQTSNKHWNDILCLQG